MCVLSMEKRVCFEREFICGWTNMCCAAKRELEGGGGGRDDVLKDGTSRQLLKNMMPWLGHNGTWRPTI